MQHSSRRMTSEVTIIEGRTKQPHAGGNSPFVALVIQLHEPCGEFETKTDSAEVYAPSPFIPRASSLYGALVEPDLCAIAVLSHLRYL